MENFAANNPSRELTSDELLSGRDLILQQIKWARQYSRQLIDSIPEALWYVQPAGLKSHVAWQVGHLAVSQYGLMLFRQRGRMPGDLELMPGWLRKQFGRGTTPSESAEGMPSPAELLAMLDKIDTQAHAEVATLTAEQLGEPTEMPYTAYPIKLGALLFCPIHESLHAGQLGLLRRLHGLDPLR
ncbi:MAG: DinB family protein [Pirellulaceae bacterium]|nr:DinB family protein [Pirellulaceae bacterium]